MAAHFPRRVTLAELVATLSLVADLGMGRPMERVLRQTVVAMRLGAAAGLDQGACTSAYYTSLLAWVGCAVDTTELAAVFGDEIGLYADTREEDLDRVTMAVFVGRHLGRGQSGFRRVGLMGKFLATAGRSVQQLMDLGNGAELKITVARWLTPNGTSISDGGLQPDIAASSTTPANVKAGQDPTMDAAAAWLMTQ